MKQSASNRKVNEQAREVIASILLFDVSDPRLHLVTITGCEVSYDRSLMAKKLSWRVAPELRFHLDKSVDQAEAIGAALASEREHQQQRIVEETIGEDREF